MNHSSGGRDVQDGGGFSSKSLSVRAQKKILGKMASRNVAKHFITDRTARLLDSLYRILKDFYSKKEAEKVIKNIIKMVIKLGVLSRNEQFSHSELQELQKFQKKFQSLAMTFISFKQVAFSYDRPFLIRLMEECQTILIRIIHLHLSEKSSQRVKMLFSSVSNPEFLDLLFHPHSPYTELVEKVCVDLSELLEVEEI